MWHLDLTHTERDSETEVVRSRKTQLVPGKYAALIIHCHPITPKQAYQKIVGTIRADETLEACKDVVARLRVLNSSGSRTLQYSVRLKL